MDPVPPWARMLLLSSVNDNPISQVPTSILDLAPLLLRPLRHRSSPRLNWSWVAHPGAILHQVSTQEPLWLSIVLGFVWFRAGC